MIVMYFFIVWELDFSLICVHSSQKVPVARVTPFGHELITFSFSVAKPPKTEFAFRK